LTNATLLGFVLIGFLYLFSTHTLHGYALVITTVLLAGFVAAAIITFFLLFHARWRRRTLFYLSQTAHWVMHRLIPHRTPPRTHIWRFQFNLNRGIQFLLSRKHQMIVPLIYIIADWVFMILTLHTAFLAVHYPIRLSFVMVGFAVGLCSPSYRSSPEDSGSWKARWRRSSPASACRSKPRSSPC